MKKQSEPLATFMALVTLAVIGKSAKHCMQKYSGGGAPRRKLRFIFR